MSQGNGQAGVETMELNGLPDVLAVGSTNAR